MPNTLAHLGVQLFAARAVAGRRWSMQVLLLALIGCVLPDVPWIVQRAMRPLLLHGPDPEILLWARLYFVAQASLLFSLLLAGAVALLLRRPARSFLVLGLGCLAHLLLDALEVKWANGVILWAPFSWRSQRLDWFWPGSAWSDAMTALGVLAVVWCAGALLQPGLRKDCSPSAAQHVRRATSPRAASRATVVALLLIGYGLGPFAVRPALLRADAHFVGTLHQEQERTGQVVELSLAAHGVDASGIWVRTLSEEVLRLDCSGAVTALCDSVEWGSGGRVSLRGRFTGVHTVSPTALHQHRPGQRVVASLVGLGAASMLLLLGVWRLRWARSVTLSAVSGDAAVPAAAPRSRDQRE